MDSTLQELRDLVCIKFPPSHKCMYGLARLNIKSQHIHHKLRRDWTEKEKEKIQDILNRLIGHESDHQFHFYKHIIYNRIVLLVQ